MGDPSKIGAERPRLVVVEAMTLTSPADPYLDLRALATYSGLSRRKLHDLLHDPVRPLGCYLVDGKILVRRSEFDGWVATYRQAGAADVDRIVNDVLGGLGQPKAPGRSPPEGA